LLCAIVHSCLSLSMSHSLLSHCLKYYLQRACIPAAAHKVIQSSQPALGNYHVVTSTSKQPAHVGDGPLPHHGFLAGPFHMRIFWAQAQRVLYFRQPLLCCSVSGAHAHFLAISLRAAYFPRSTACLRTILVRTLANIRGFLGSSFTKSKATQHVLLVAGNVMVILSPNLRDRMVTWLPCSQF